MGCYAWTRLLGWLAIPLFSGFAQAQIDLEGAKAVSGVSSTFTSLIESSGLARRYIFNISFETNSIAWIAASDGLYRYDGYEWRRFTKENGLPSDFVRCVFVDNGGGIWAGTDSGAVRYDGSTFHTFGSEKGLAGPSVRRISQDPDGTLWFCCDRWPDRSLRGGISSLKDGLWRSYRESDGLPSDYVYSYFRDSTGNQYLFTNKGAARKSGEQWIPWDEPGLLAGTLMVEANPGMFFLKPVATQPPLVRRAGQWIAEPTGGLGPLCKTRQGEVLNVAYDGDSEDLWLLKWTGKRFEPISGRMSCLNGSVQNLAEAPDGSVWCVGLELLVRWQPEGEWTTYSGLPPARACDNQQRVWFANANRALRHTQTGWETVEGFGGLMALDARGFVWSWTNSTITHWTANGPVAYGSSQSGLGEVQNLVVDGQQSLWFYGKNLRDETSVAVFTSEGQWSHPSGTGLAGKNIIRAASDARSGAWFLLAETPQSPRVLAWVTLEKTVFCDLPLPSINYRDSGLLVDQRGVWFFGFSGLHRLDEENGMVWNRVPGLLGNNVYGGISDGNRTCFLIDGRSGGGSGYVIFETGHVRQMKANIEWLCARGSDGTFYLKEPGGLVVLPPKPRDTPFFLALPRDNAVSGIVQGLNNSLWINTPDAVLHYQAGSDPPRTFITECDPRAREGEPLRLRLRAGKRWSPDHPQTAFSFSWQIDQGEWSPFQSPPDAGISTRGHGPGLHRLSVRSVFEGAKIDPVPATITFLVTPIPLQERRWFWPAALGLFVLLFASASSALFSKHKLALNANRLEEMVKDRTAQLTVANESLLREVGDRRRAEEALRQNEERLERIVATVPNGITILDLDGRVVFANKAAEQILRLTRSAIDGRLYDDPAWHITTPDGRPFPVDQLPFRRVLGTQKPVHGIEHAIEDANGARTILSINAAPLREANGVMMGVVAVFSDITERKQSETEKDKLQTQLLHAQKMESIGRLAGGIAHDFNNMLQVILGNVTLSIDDAPPESQLRGDLLEIQHAAQRSSELTRQLLAFARKQTVHPKVLDLNSAISGMLKMLQRLVSEEIQLVWQPGNDLWPVKMDPTQLDQILANLIVNARDAIRGTGKIILQTSNVTLDQVTAERLPDGLPGDFLRLSVRDTGCGMDAHTLSHLFEPFFTTKGVGEGTGLGLATVYGIVRQNGGFIAVQSQPGQGTEFNLHWPRLSQAENDSPPKAAAEAKPSLRGSETVLLAEDEQQVLKLGSRILRNHGYCVLAASTPEEALRLAEHYPEPIHLLVTDMVMPGMNGQELTQRLSALKPGIKSLFVSGYAADIMLQQHGLQETMQFLSKPFTVEMLARKVREILDG